MVAQPGQAQLAMAAPPPPPEQLRKARHAEIQRTLGQRIAARRRAQGISMREMGERIGVSGHQVQKYEAGQDMLSASTLYRISLALEQDVSDLVRGLDPGEPNQAPAPAPLPHAAPQAQERLELVANFSRITDPALRRLLLQTVRRIAAGQDAPA